MLLSFVLVVLNDAGFYQVISGLALRLVISSKEPLNRHSRVGENPLPLKYQININQSFTYVQDDKEKRWQGVANLQEHQSNKKAAQRLLF